MKNRAFIHSFETELGRFNLMATEKGINFISFGRNSNREFRKVLKEDLKGFSISEGGSENKKCERQIRRYLSGKLKKFDLKLDLTGTPFQRKVLGQVSKIPFGKTATYGEIAKRSGNARAARAVGAANAGNRLPIVVPCHRVVASGGLGGYAGGTAMKKRLLNLERLHNK
jgi:methylated-DNA-[protein]-cysteine S-methyltransferase